MGTAIRLVTVTGTATDADLVSVFVNQTEASLNAQTYTAEVLFTVGTNVVTAVATDAAGNTASSQIECYYRPSLASLVEYEYDKNGCLVGKAVDGTYYTVYEYDYENRLTRVTLPDASTNEFVYDGDKRRVSRKDASGEEKWFLYDGINILQDLATDGTVWTSYVQGIGIDKLISVSEWAGQTSPQKRYYHSDAIGSVRSLTDEDETEVGTYTYDAWGKVTSETGSSENEYKFTSRRWEEDLGLQYNRARFYDPETGRVITPDPLTGGPDDPTISYFSGVYSQFHRFIKEHIGTIQPDKHNRYVYCYNNPINLIDPLGLEGTNVDSEIQLSDSTPSPEISNPPTPSEAPSVVDTANRGVTSEEVKKDNYNPVIVEAINKIAQSELGRTELGEKLTSNLKEELESGRIELKDLPKRIGGQYTLETDIISINEAYANIASMVHSVALTLAEEAYHRIEYKEQGIKGDQYGEWQAKLTAKMPLYEEFERAEPVIFLTPTQSDELDAYRVYGAEGLKEHVIETYGDLPWKCPERE